MFSEILMTYIFDKFDRQIIKKVPYALFFSLILYASVLNFGANLSAYLSLLIFAILTVIFVFSTTFFNSKISNAFEEFIPYNDLRNLTQKLRDIVEGNSSVIDDLRRSENWSLILSGILGGISFTLLLTLALYIIIYYLGIGILLTIPMIVLLVIYIYQDLSKTNLFEEYQVKERPEALFAQNILQTYIVDNSLKSFPIKKMAKVILKFVALLIGPICNLEVPKVGIEMLLVYWNQEVQKLIKEMEIKEQEKLETKERRIGLKQEQGISVEELFNESKRGERISVMIENSPKEIFPYLLTSEYKYKPEYNKVWIALKIVEHEKAKEKIQGYMFIHKFRGLSKKTLIKSHGKIRFEYQGEPVLFFILIGRQEYIQYLKTRIEILSVKYPTNLISIEEAI